MTEKKNRTIHYSFKATPEEDAIIQKKMKTFGIKNQSAFIRAMALNGYVLKLDLPELHDAVRLMGSLSNNVNQIARRLNERGSIFETEIDDIANRQEELRTILSSILRRLDPIQHRKEYPWQPQESCPFTSTKGKLPGNVLGNGWITS